MSILDTMNLCVYCNNPGVSKEHIWPKALIKRLPGYRLKYSESADKFFQGHQTINDVCETCNNTWSSQLDEYFCQLYDIYFEKFVEDMGSVIFEYDYDRFLKWLLKISYNTSRTTRIDSKALSAYSDYIKGVGERPDEIFLFVELITPTTDQNGNKIYPMSTRCGRLQISLNIPWATFRAVSVNSYYFYIIICQPHISIEHEPELLSLFEKFPGQYLSPVLTSVNLRASRNKDAVASHLDYYRSNFEKYQDFMSSQKK